MDILRVLRAESRSTSHDDGSITTTPATTQLFHKKHQQPDKPQQIIDQRCGIPKHDEESVEKTTAAADLFPRIVRLSCMMRQPDCMDKRDVVITVLENPSGSWAAGNGSTLWDSAIALSGYLLKHQISWLQGKRGLELGAGN